MAEMAVDAPREVHGKTTGIIYPPPDLRSIVDKTAQFVAKNGAQFEMRILAAEQNNLKFSFLRPTDVFHAYYQAKVAEFRDSTDGEGKAPQAQGQAQGEPAQEANADDASAEGAQDGAPAAQLAPVETGTIVSMPAVHGAIAQAARRVPRDQEPPSEEFLIHHPQLSAMESEIIKLTAQYTAVSGKQFLAGLAAREFKNPQFDFLKSTHALFGYFTSLVESYTKCLRIAPAYWERVEGAISDRQSVLARCLHRLEWERQLDARRREERAEVEAERVAYQTIDWHDFVIVETIDFDDGLDASLPAPVDLAAQTAGGDDMEMDMDEDEEDAVAVPAAPAPGDAEDEEIKVRLDYRSSVAAPAGPATAKFFVDPTSGRQIPIQHSSEHMRIELLDPKWREQTQRALDKHRDTSYASGDAIAANLARLARKRTDIFGGESEEDRAHKRARTAEAEAEEEEAQRQLEAMKRRAASAAGVTEPPAPRPAAPPATAAHPPPPPPAAPRPPAMPTPSTSMPPPSLPGSSLPPPTLPTPMPPPPSFAQAAPPAPPAAARPAVPPPTAPPPTVPLMPPGATVLPPSSTLADMPNLVSAAAWMKQHPGPLKLAVQVPAEQNAESWPLNGQTLAVTCQQSDGVRDLKQQLSDLLNGMPPAKMQLKVVGLGFTKDAHVMAHYNLQDGAVLELTLRKRGGGRR